MASLAQIEANRRNARLSTGPSTPEGKASSSQNSYKHGLTAEKAVSVYDDITSFWELEQSFLDQFQPVGSLELHLVRTIISAAGVCSGSRTWRPDSGISTA